MGSARAGSNPVGVVFVRKFSGKADAVPRHVHVLVPIDSMAERSKAPA
jgi:hypothetical protein